MSTFGKGLYDRYLLVASAHRSVGLVHHLCSCCAHNFVRGGTLSVLMHVVRDHTFTREGFVFVFTAKVLTHDCGEFWTCEKLPDDAIGVVVQCISPKGYMHVGCVDVTCTV